MNYDHPDSLETDLLVEHLKKLKAGESVECPVYDYSQHNRSHETIHVEPKRIILVEGILLLTDPRVRELLDISRYLDHFIAVCDDIWHGGEDYRDWTEVYVRGLADICQGLAAEFDVVCEMTAGLPHLWKGELPRV